MKRRQLLLGLSAVVSSSAAVVGSGAFSAVEAERQLKIDVVADKDAYLTFEDISNYAVVNDGVIELQFDGQSPPLTEGNGLGPESVYEFSDVLFVQNNGNQEVELFSKYDGESVSDIHLTQSTDVNSSMGGKNQILTENNPSEPLGPGDAFNIGIVIDTAGMSPGTVNTTLDIVATSAQSE
ncbi:DUF1102 domain-containing protein [Halorubrum ezzemoulense]|uniref:DUF1102 domain-containing protein n=1 Tax=Halorubrum ezzemoulense TaxID=337243 RepID=UPI0023310150|nr:DUF1102 domain-containing protein [Halorubrum ezzemoulense]MDB2270342.1 DUF1102 domain-containing protein [Halorubrum ezzemoulense]